MANAYMKHETTRASPDLALAFAEWPIRLGLLHRGHERQAGNHRPLPGPSRADQLGYGILGGPVAPRHQLGPRQPVPSPSFPCYPTGVAIRGWGMGPGQWKSLRYWQT